MAIYSTPLYFCSYPCRLLYRLLIATLFLVAILTMPLVVVTHLDYLWRRFTVAIHIATISTLAKESSSVNLSLDFSRYIVTQSDFSDHSITFPNFVIMLDYIPYLTPSGLELESIASGPPK